MPVSKRDKKVSLTKTTKKGMDHKKKIVANIRKYIELYDHLFVFSVNNMRNAPLKTLREEWKENSRFLFAKKKVMKIALGGSPAEETQKNIHKLTGQIVGQCGLLFTNKPKEEVIKWCLEYSEMDYAKAGFVATETVTIPAGPLPMFAPSIEQHLRTLGLPTKLVKGIIELREDYTVCTAGDELKSNQTSILKLFGKQIAEFKIILLCVWSKDGSFEKFKVAEELRRTPNPKNISSENQKTPTGTPKQGKQTPKATPKQNKTTPKSTPQSTPSNVQKNGSTPGEASANVTENTPKQGKTTPIPTPKQDKTTPKPTPKQDKTTPKTTPTSVQNNVPKPAELSPNVPQDSPKVFKQTPKKVQVTKENNEEEDMEVDSPKPARTNPRRSMRTPKPIRRTPEQAKQSVKKLTESAKHLKKTPARQTPAKAKGTPAKGTPAKGKSTAATPAASRTQRSLAKGFDMDIAE